MFYLTLNNFLTFYSNTGVYACHSLEPGRIAWMLTTDPDSTSFTYLWLSVCDFWLICTGCRWRHKSVHPHGSSGLHNCAKSRAASVCLVGLCNSSKGAQILSPVLHPELCSIGVTINYCQWSWAYGLKRVLNDFVFSFIVTYLIHITGSIRHLILFTNPLCTILKEFKAVHILAVL